MNSYENNVKLIEDYETNQYYNFIRELYDSYADVELENHIRKNEIGFNELEIYSIRTQFNNILLKKQ